MHRSIYTHVAVRVSGAFLPAFLGWHLGRFRGVWWTPGLGATPVSLLAQAEVALEYEWSCSPACVVDGALPPALHVVAELALARPRLVGAPGVVRRLAKRGVAQIR